MALQGTIDSFPLTDVLTLLSTSKKSGRLALDGDRGSAALWITDGEVIGGDMAGGAGATAASLLFEMLRFGEASFVFDDAPAGVEPQQSVEATPLGDAMAQASALLVEWDDILAVVPSLAHRVVLVEELPEDSVTLDAASWSLVLAAASNPVVAVIGDALGLDEFGACSAGASLAERGLATIEEPVAFEPPRVAFDEIDADEPASGATAVSDTPARPAIDLADRGDADDHDADEDRTASAFPDRFPIDDLLGGDAADADDTWGSPEAAPFASASFERASFDGGAFDEASDDEQSFDGAAFGGLPPLERVPLGEESTSGPDAWDDLLPAADLTDDEPAEASEGSEETDDSTDEVLRQMSKLSPQAAEAIAAALSSVPSSAPAPEAPTPRGDADGDGDGPVTFSGMF